MAVLFADDFNRSNSGTLGGNWTALASSFSIVSNQAVCSSSAASTYYNATNGPADGYIQTTVVTFSSPSNYLGLVYRLDTSTFNGYYLGMDTTGTLLWRIDGGVPTAMGSAYAAPSNGDVIRVEFNGSTHEVFYNGVSKGTRTDGTYTGANRCALSGQGTAGVIDNFEVGDFTLPPATLTQEGYRFYSDDAGESSSTALAAQDTGITLALSTPVHLRVLLDATDDPASAAFRLEYKKSTDSVYVPVLTAAPSAPTYQAIGSVASGTGNVTVNWPTHQAGDIGILFIESTGGQAASLGTANGFAAITGSPSATGATTSGTQLTAYWCRATSGSMSSPIITDPGDHAIGYIVTFRGCIAEGSPFDGSAVAAQKASASTSASAPGITTTVANALVVAAISRDNDSASAAFSSWTNSDLASITERGDTGSTQGNGGGIGVATGVKTAAGAVGTTTATVTSSINASLTMALIPQSTPIIIAASSHITAGGDATTARLTAPSGKTTSDFTTGRIWDNENGTDSIDIAADEYTELAWVIKAQTPAADSDVYQFRVTAAGTALDTYTVTPSLTVSAGSSDTPLSVDAGALTLDGVSITLSYTANVVLAVDAAALTLAGQSITLTPTANVAVSVTEGALTVSGVAVGLATALTVSEGSLALAGATVGLLATDNRTLAVDAAALTLAGVDVTLAATANEALAVDAASLTLAGEDVTLDATFGVTMSVTAAALTLAGADVTLSFTDSRTLAVDAASLNLAGVSITLTATDNKSVSVTEGSLTLAGATITLAATANAFLSVDAASLTLAGQSVTLAKTDHVWMSVTAGALTLAGAEVGFAYTDSRTLAVDAGDLTLSGVNIALQAGNSAVVAVEPAELTLDGAAVTLTHVDNVTLALLPAGMTLTGETVGLTLTIALSASALSVAGQGQTFALTLTVEPADLLLSEGDIGLAATANAWIDVEPAILLLAGAPITLKLRGGADFHCVTLTAKVRSADIGTSIRTANITIVECEHD